MLEHRATEIYEFTSCLARVCGKLFPTRALLLGKIMDRLCNEALAQFKTLPEVYRVFILSGLFFFTANRAIDVGEALGRFLFHITH
jgi:hypothetical protein